jgi:hypothetical protein
MMRISAAALAAVLAFVCPSLAPAAEVVAPSNGPLVQSVVTLEANTDTTIGNDKGRRYLCLMNIGTGLVTLGFDQTAVAGSGWALAPTTTSGGQGGSMCWEASFVTGNAVHVISAAGSIVVVLEGF